MPPQPPKRTATASGPRHAAPAVPRARISGALTGGTGGFPHVDVLEGETSLGRHRRPESLADDTVLRPTAAVAGPARGRHASADSLSITVRPLASVPAGDKRPAIGSHRAPGTLPIEKWLLIGRHRQQALLAALVAVGVMLIVFPMQQSDTSPPVDTIAAADHAVVKPTSSQARSGEKVKDKDEQRDAPATTPTETPKPEPSDSARAAEPNPSFTPSPAVPSSAAPEVVVPAGTGPGQSLRSTGTQTVALTFDDGPDPVQTPKILDLLAKNDVKATFCLVGEQVRKHPEIVRDIVAAGHTLCNHTWNHSLTIGKDKPEQIQRDLLRTNREIQKAAPGAPIPFFRAPGGNFSKVLVQTAYADGMTSLYWMVDPADWDHPKDETDEQHVARVIKSVQENTKGGSIVLSHDFGQPDTIEAYETLIPWLQERFTLGLPTIPAPPSATPPAPPSLSAPPLN